MTASVEPPPPEMHRRLLDVLRAFRAHRKPVLPPPLGSYLADADVPYLLMRLLDAMQDPTPEMLAAGAKEAEFIGAGPEEKARQIWTAMAEAALRPLADAELARIATKSPEVSR